jgi:hypothetical protein
MSALTPEQEARVRDMVAEMLAERDAAAKARSDAAYEAFKRVSDRLLTSSSSVLRKHEEERSEAEQASYRSQMPRSDDQHQGDR